MNIFSYAAGLVIFILILGAGYFYTAKTMGVPATIKTLFPSAPDTTNIKTPEGTTTENVSTSTQIKHG
jgi:hypothetical protein